MRLLKIVINIFIFCLLSLLISASMFITCSKNFISQENMSKFINDANILNTDINILFNKEPKGITLKQKLIELAKKNEIPLKIIEDILNSKQINQLLGDFFSQTIYYGINGYNKPVILDSTVNDMKEIAKKSLNKNINIMINEKEMNLMIENYCKDIVDIVPERDELIGELPIDLFQDIVSFKTIYVYIIIIIVLLLIMITGKHWFSSLGYLGVSMAVSGILFVVVGSMDYLINNLVISQMSGMQQFIEPLITNALTLWFKSGVLVGFSSIILILIYLTLNRMESK